MFNLFMKFPAKIREILLYFINVLKIKKTYKVYTKFPKIIKNDKYNNWGKYTIDKDVWKKSYKKLSIKTPEGINEAEYFFEDKIDIIKETKIKKGVILICLVKNDLTRIKQFIKHHKKIGIVNFAIIDNGSDDGTFEYLESIDEINLFQIKEKYTTIRRQSWINRVISYYGFNRWYLILDSDEFLTYNDMENHNINNLIEYYELNGIERCRALMIDMYPESYLIEKEKIDNISFRKIFSYFDIDTYMEKENKYFLNIVGGMRKRVFSDNNEKVEPFLIKYPLLFFKKGDIQSNSHYSYPFYKNFNSNSYLNLGLLHYKFLPTDLNKIKEIVKNENFANGSKEYKSYLNFYQKNSKMTPTYEKSKKYTKSSDIYEIKKLKKINW